jgi:hypothetical protein
MTSIVMSSVGQPQSKVAEKGPKILFGELPEKIDALKAAYWQTQRLLTLSEVKLTYLENNTEALEAMPIREFRTLAKTVSDLQQDLLRYAELIEEEESRPELKEAPLVETLKSSPSSSGGQQNGSVGAQGTAQKQPQLLTPAQKMFGKNFGKKKR